MHNNSKTNGSVGRNGENDTIQVERFTIGVICGDLQKQNDKNFNSESAYSDVGSSEIEVRIMPPEKSMFNSTIGSIVSCLGSAVGTGNIWRFPRIVATHSYARGKCSLSFYVAWIILLFLWSIPIIVIEYALGRFTRNSVPAVFYKFFGKYFVWVGGWLATTVFFLSAYYPVIVGWCLYYLWVSCTAAQLPGDEEAGLALFNGFARDSAWPVLTQMVVLIITGAFIFGGIRWIERANLFLVPLLLLIVIFTFGWSLTRQYSDVGISFLLTPHWQSLAMPGVWIAAASQNAFDTGAGISVLLTYATFMSRSSGIVRYSFLIPITNNLVSFYMSITIFSTVFSTLVSGDGTLTRSAILKIIQFSGPGSTGLTFTWIPVLFSKVGIFGRVLCFLFFLCLLVAGLSSLLPNIQVVVISLKELGVPHRIAVSAALICIAAAGIPSALKLEILENQDNTWGYALIISGLLLTSVVLIYGPLRFRRVLINDFGTDDWKIPLIWVFIISILVPIEGIVLLAWWILDYVREDPTWYILTLQSLTSTLLEWAVVIIVLVIANLLAVRFKPNLYEEARKFGCDPYDSFTYEAETELELDGITISNSE
ncbi:Sodium-and chloride-dependent GABA transporter ine [Fasciola hepatica]|uniref:Sodium-and chloride-dependent GABA transporter ine n=1 Tax=Fasciola hepatica TaxID=6192 RepID=A0A4E0RCX7_FASHE|nr:Sodium-and chloride-dependent GABA transporter ine [Fasciola hepatica]